MSCGFPTISRNYIGDPAWELHHRTGYDACGFGVHGGKHSEEFNETFWNQCGNWARSFDSIARNYGGFTLDWVGDVGVSACKPGFHQSGRAFDLTHLRDTGGDFIDMNEDWSPSHDCSALFFTRRYIGVAASLRRYFGTVLTAWYNVEHQNHIHFDNGVAVGPIRSNAKTDTTLVQATCRYMNGEGGLAIDGVWGPLTEAAYGRLRTKLHMGCRSPRQNTTDARLFLLLIARTGLAGVTAGTYVGPC
jgi:hypothetical protein